MRAARGMNRRSRLSRADRLSTVEIIARMVVADRRPETALQRSLDYMIRELRAADAGIVWRYDHMAGRLIPLTASGADIDALEQLQIVPGDGLIGRVFETGKRELYTARKDASSTRTASHPDFGTTIPGLDGPATAVCLSLNAGGAKHGVLTLVNLEEGSRFSRSDLSFFQVIATLFTLLMEKVALVAEIEAKQASGNDDRYKAALIPTLCHEMRTPLTSIKGYSTALLMDDAVFTPESQREFLEIIDRECDTLEGLISDYLESSAIDAGKMKIDPQPVRLPRLAAEAAEEEGRRLTGHSLIVDFPSEFPLIDADPERILQVLRQLLDNAAKYSPNGGMIVLQGKVAEGRVIISVADEGVGIDPEDLNHLFERFFRAKSDSGGRPRIIGTGLGLPISRAIVEAHGGHIWAESQPGQGSKFYFTLPTGEVGPKAPE
jgi:signal transduction histidine kinase